jgi:hypothetical protein
MMSGPLDELIEGVDPALAAAVLEIEGHIASVGWDQPARLYALVPTAELVAKEPVLAHAMGLDDAAAQGSLTPVEQEPLGEASLEESLESIVWPPGVAGCAAVVERLVLPPAAEPAVLADPESAATYAREHPDRQDVRIVAGATRAGATYCALRMRAADDEQSVLTGADLVPGLLELLRLTLDDAELIDAELTDDGEDVP